MRLKKDFILHDSDGDYVIVAVGEAAKNFHGLVHLNNVAGKIIEFLKEDISEEELINKMLEVYDVDPDTLKKDVNNIVSQLKNANIVE